MNFRYIVSICVCCCLWLSLSAQNVGMTDNISLNGGSTIRGVILSKTLENTIIQLDSGAEISVPTSSIIKIDPVKKHLSYFTRGKARKEKGYFGFIKTGFLNARIENDFLSYEWGLTLQTVHGYRFSKKLSAGIGIGIDKYDEDLEILPLYAHVRYEPFDKKIRFYFSGDIGYGIMNPSSDERFSGGFMLQPAIGIQFSSRSGGGVFLEWGQKFQWTKRSIWWAERDDKLRFNRSAITFGYQF